MTTEELLRAAFVSVEVDETFTHATALLKDNSQLRFCHSVDERWVKTETAGQGEVALSLAHDLLARIAMFRLNHKHLDVEFYDGGRWEVCFK